MTRDELENCIHALERAAEKSTVFLHELYDRACEIDPFIQRGRLLDVVNSFAEAYTEIAALARSIFPTEAGVVYVAASESERKVVEPVTAWPTSRRKQASFARDDCWALRTGKTYVVDADHPGPFCKHVSAASCTSSLCVPLMAKGHALGVFHLWTSPGPKSRSNGTMMRLPEATQRSAVTFARRIAPVLANLQLLESLRAQAIRDPLTDLFNRRLFKETLDRELRRASHGRKRRGDEAQAKGKPVGILMIDIDRFRQFNTKATHQGGDDVLRLLGALLQKTFRRAGDMVFRYGGDEFTVILPGASVEISRQRAEEFRKQVQQIPERLPDGHAARVTVSIGVAVFPEHGETREAVIGAADRALMLAKGKGRNRVEVAKLRPGKRGKVRP
jgi:diguanylate cyclase (GGDEF)-like protein